MQCGYTVDEIYLLFKKYSKQFKYIDFKNIIKIIYGLLIKRKLIINGLNSGEVLEKIINEAGKNKNIENINQIKLPLLITTVNLNTGELYFISSQEKRKTFSDKIKYINNFNIGKAVRASCSYPLVFSPLRDNGVELIDGGLRENIPWKGLKELGADKVISVIFSKEINENCCNNIVDVVNRSMDIMCHELSNYELEGAEYLIRIKTKKIGLLDMTKIDELYELGYKIAKEKLKNNVLKNTY